MNKINQRKKNPELVRQTLLDSAIKLAENEGFTNISLQKVSSMAGVTKGALLHHFPNKRSFIDALYVEVVNKIDFSIETYMANDVAYGCFTRAYIRSSFDDMRKRGGASTCTLSMLLDDRLGKVWNKWLQDRLAKHHDTDSGSWLEMLRYSADGVWLGASYGSLNDLDQLQERLIKATRVEVEV